MTIHETTTPSSAHPYRNALEPCALDGDGLRGCADPDCWASCGACGNGTCDPLETCSSCPSDCMCAALCGDLVCGGGETKASCPGDCP